MRELKKGVTSVTDYFFLVDNAAGTPKTGVAMTNLYLAYTRTREATVNSVCSSLTAATAAFSAYGASEVDATNAPGLYRVDIPNAAFSSNSSVTGVILTVTATSTSSVAPAMKEVDLVANVAQDNYSLVSAGVVAVTVTGNVGGSVGSVVGNVGGSVGSVVGGVGGAVAGSVGSVVGNVGGSVASVVGNVGGSVGSVAGGVTGSVGSVVGNVGGSVGSVVGGVGGTVALVASVTGGVGGAVGSVTGNVGGSVGSVVGGVGGTVALVASVTGNVGGSVGSVVGNVGGSVGSVVGGVGATVTAAVSSNADKTGYVLSAVGSAALTEDYAADGATCTLNQILYMLLQNMGEFSISQATKTVKKLDGSTTAMQYSFDSQTSPTATTRFA